MPFIVTETHYEYNDETYNSPDAEHGKEPGVPVAVFNTKAEAEADRWQREKSTTGATMTSSVDMYTKSAMVNLGVVQGTTRPRWTSTTKSDASSLKSLG